MTTTTSASGGMPLRMGSTGATPGLGALAGAPMTPLSHLAVGRGRPLDAELVGSFTSTQPSEPATRAVQFAKTKLGLPYIWGAQGPRAYDCSGLVQDAYRHAGISLPRNTYDMIAVGTPAPRSDIRRAILRCRTSRRRAGPSMCSWQCPRRR